MKAIHAGLECGLFLEKYPSLDMVSFGPTLRGVHSPDERMLIPTVDKFWRHLLDVLVNNSGSFMRKLIYSLLWAVCGMSAAPAQAQHAFRVMEYNVENLFDCRHDSLKQDTEFLPGSVRNWTYRRFQDKVNKIGKVILAAGKEQVPDWWVCVRWKMTIA